MSNVVIGNLLKDLGAAAKRVVSKPDVITGSLTNIELEQLRNALEVYTPKSDQGIENRTKALEIIFDVIGGTGSPEEEPLDDTTQALVDQLDADTPEAPAAEEPAAEPFLGAEFDTLAAGQKIQQDTIVLEIHIRQPGFDKSINTRGFVAKEKGIETCDQTGDESEKKVDYDRIAVTAKTVDKKYTKALTSCRNEFYSWLKKKSLHSSYLANGMFLIPIRLIGQVDDKIQDFIKERQELVNEFETKYEEAKEDAKAKFGDHYDESKYPAFTEIRSRYLVEARWLTLNVPQALNKINKAIYLREQEKMKLELADAAQEVRDALRYEFNDYISRMQERLGKDEKTGKPKVFQHTRLDLLKEFVETFDDRNLTGDTDLSHLVGKAKQLLNNVDLTEIRTNATLRETLEKGFAEITEISSSMITTSKGRKFKLEDED